MKRSVIDVLRRAFDNAVANWPLILIRIAEVVVLAGLVIGAVIAAVIPVLVSAGLNKFDFGNPENAMDLFATLVVQHWMLILYLLLLATVILGVLIAVHSFVEGGSARVYIDGERVAGFRAFAVDRWWDGGRRHWWAIFWIYNLAWSVAGIVLLVPLALTIAGMLAASDVGPRLAVGCIGLAFTFLILIPMAILVGMWTQKAIVIRVARSIGAVESLRASRREIRLDFGRHLGVWLLLMVLSIIAAGVLSSVTMPFSFGSHIGGRDSIVPLLFAPVQIVMSVVQNALSAAMGAWFLAAFVALTEER